MQLKRLGILAITPLFLLTGVPIASAQTTDTSTIQAQIQALLNQINDLRNQLATLLQQQATNIITGGDSTTTPTMGPGRCIIIARDLRRGDSGDDVKELQQTLAQDQSTGFPPGLITGFFGEKTANALIKFQLNHGVISATSTAGGLFGPATRGMFMKLCNQVKNEIKKGDQNNQGEGEHRGDDRGNNGGTTTPDTIAPIISGVAVHDLGVASAHIFWITNEPATSRIWYGTTNPVDTSGAPSVTSDALTTTHNLLLPNLSATTTYFFVVSSSDHAGNTTNSDQSSFTTAGL